MPEQVRARHILLSLGADASAEEAAEVQLRANEILTQIREGADFAALASELSEDPGSKTNGGDLGFFARGQMVKEFEDAAFSLEPGTVSELVKSEYGYHVIRVEEHRDAQQRSFEEVREELAAELMGLEVARTESRAIADRIAEAIRSGASLEDAARAEKLTLQRSDRLQRRADGYIPDLGSSEAVMAAAFNMEPGQSSDRVFEVDGSMVLIQVMERFPPDEDALEAAVDQERTLLASQKQQAYLSTWINQARTKLAERRSRQTRPDRDPGERSRRRPCKAYRPALALTPCRPQAPRHPTQVRPVDRDRSMARAARRAGTAFASELEEAMRPGRRN